jgi:hypothetical protein
VPEDAVTLGWQAPEGCPDEHFVLDRVSRLADEQSPPEAPIHVTARIEPVGDGFRLWLEMIEGTSLWQQQFDDPSCAALAEAASVVIALAIGRERSKTALEPQEPTSAGSNEASGTAQVDTATEPDTGPALSAWSPRMKPRVRRTLGLGSRQTSPLHPGKPPSGSRWQRPPHAGSPRPTAGEPSPTLGWKSALVGAFVQAGVIGDFGALPASAPGLLIGAGLEGREGRSVLVSGSFLPTTRGTSDKVPEVGGDFRLRTATVAGCQATQGTPASLELCVGVELGQLRASGVHGDWSDTRKHLWLAPGADAGAELHLGRASALVSVGGVVPLVRKDYTMDNAGSIHQPNWLAGRLAVVARYRL